MLERRDEGQVKFTTVARFEVTERSDYIKDSGLTEERQGSLFQSKWVRRGPVKGLCQNGSEASRGKRVAYVASPARPQL